MGMQGGGDTKFFRVFSLFLSVKVLTAELLSGRKSFVQDVVLCMSQTLANRSYGSPSGAVQEFFHQPFPRVTGRERQVLYILLRGHVAVRGAYVVVQFNMENGQNLRVPQIRRFRPIFRILRSCIVLCEHAVKVTDSNVGPHIFLCDSKIRIYKYLYRVVGIGNSDDGATNISPCKMRIFVDYYRKTYLNKTFELLIPK